MTYANAAFAALADGTRRDLLTKLARRPASVGELARDLPISRPAVSQHLKALKAAGLVRDEAVGTRRVYHIDPAGLGPIRRWLDDLWGDALAAFAEAVDADDGDADDGDANEGDQA